MKTRILGNVLGSLVAVAGLAAALAFSQPADYGDEGTETTIKLAEAPEAVKAAAVKMTPANTITKVIRETDDGITTYEIEFNENGTSGSGTFATTGEMLELERGTTEAKVPAAAMDALKKANPGATFSSMSAVTKFYYEIEVVKDGKKHEVKVSASGEIEEPTWNHAKANADEKDEMDEKDEKDGD
ncbi:MAG: PepSY domain-containing protein [Phycisphaerales bacterium]|jgi:hypothetical protein